MNHGNRMYQRKIEQLSALQDRHNRLHGTRVRDARVYGSLAFAWVCATVMTAIDGHGLVWAAWGAGLLVWSTATTVAIVAARRHRQHGIRLGHRIGYLLDLDQLSKYSTKRHL